MPKRRKKGSKKQKFVDPRTLWVLGSELEVLSPGSSNWFRGKITQIFNDNEGEWLQISWQDPTKGVMVREVQRYSDQIEPINDNDNETNNTNNNGNNDGDSTDVSPKKVEVKEEPKNEVLYPVSNVNMGIKVKYCKHCELPPEYCKYKPDIVNMDLCVKWIRDKYPEMYRNSYENDDKVNKALKKIAKIKEQERKEALLQEQNMSEQFDNMDINDDNNNGNNKGNYKRNKGYKSNKRGGRIERQDLLKVTNNNKNRSTEAIKPKNNDNSDSDDDELLEANRNQRGGGKKAYFKQRKKQRKDERNQERNKRTKNKNKQILDEDELVAQRNQNNNNNNDNNNDDEGEGKVNKMSPIQEETSSDIRKETQPKKNTKKDKGKKKKIITVLSKKVKGNKRATMVRGMIELGMKPKIAQSAFRKKFATGVGCNPTPDGSKEFVLQGDLRYDIMKFMDKKWNVPHKLLFYESKKGLIPAFNDDGICMPPP